MGLKITVLGSGNSTGVPMANGSWGTCDPAEPRNRRCRASILIEQDGARILVDAGPDLRQQMLRVGIDRLDAVIFTHAHADHTQGIDDLRVFGEFGGNPVPIYAFPEVLEQIRSRFRYMFGSGREGYYSQPSLEARDIAPRISIAGVDLTLFDQDHVVCRTLGIRVGSFAYSTDVKNLSAAAFDALTGLDVWLVAAVRREPHLAHAHLEEVLTWIRKAAPERAILTHLNHTMDYHGLSAELPAGIEPAYDGMTLELDV